MSMHIYDCSGNEISASGYHYLNETFMCMWSVGHGLHCNDLICGKNLSTHLREVHGVHGSDKTRVPCRWNTCNKEVNKESLGRHIEEIHMRVAYKCEQCPKAFSRKDTLNKHKRTCSGQY
ncbi:hypothetical protein BDR04DRAFT_41804 [Suillus decipiens]|nr:hypothetical protein BDR04DRAFT_41804 [Suillus decipiens]